MPQDTIDTIANVLQDVLGDEYYKTYQNIFGGLSWENITTQCYSSVRRKCEGVPWISFRRAQHRMYRKVHEGVRGKVMGRIIWFGLFQKLLHTSRKSTELAGYLKSRNESLFSIYDTTYYNNMNSPLDATVTNFYW